MKVRDAINLIEDSGWYLARTSKPGLVTIAGQLGHDLPPGTLNSILKQAGLK